MHAQDTYALFIVCMSARKKAPVNAPSTFKLYMFIGVSMQLRELSVLIPYCWSVALVIIKKIKKYFFKIHF